MLEGGLTMPERLDAWLGGVLAGRQRTTPFEVHAGLMLQPSLSHFYTFAKAVAESSPASELFV